MEALKAHLGERVESNNGVTGMRVPPSIAYVRWTAGENPVTDDLRPASPVGFDIHHMAGGNGQWLVRGPTMQ